MSNFKSFDDPYLIFSIEKFEISNEVEDQNFSSIFTYKDYKKVRYYIGSENKNSFKNFFDYGFQATLKQIKKRLDLIGYSLLETAKKYENYRKHIEPYFSGIMTFEEYYNDFVNINIKESDVIKYCIENELPGMNGSYDLGEYEEKVINGVKKIYNSPKILFKENYGKFIMPKSIFSTSEYFVDREFYGQIDPLIKLRILADNPENLDLKVTWRPIDFIKGNLFSKQDIFKERYFDKILIATEGKTDAYILSKVLEELFPEIADIFYFFDYSREESLNVSGCKDLHKFCKYITQTTHGKIIALFDNDGDGDREYHEAKKLEEKDLLVTKLPNLKQYDKYIKESPWGEEELNLNGKAIAIEFFLDIPQKFEIKWEKGKNVQGKLKDKIKYQHAFEDAVKEKKLNTTSYNTEKLEYLINYLIEKWIEFIE